MDHPVSPSPAPSHKPTEVDSHSPEPPTLSPVDYNVLSKSIHANPKPKALRTTTFSLSLSILTLNPEPSQYVETHLDLQDQDNPPIVRF